MNLALGELVVMSSLVPEEDFRGHSLKIVEEAEGTPFLYRGLAVLDTWYR